jgi:hypothetical protein
LESTQGEDVRTEPAGHLLGRGVEVAGQHAAVECPVDLGDPVVVEVVEVAGRHRRPVVHRHRWPSLLPSQYTRPSAAPAGYQRPASPAPGVAPLGDDDLYLVSNQLHRQKQFHGGKDQREKPYVLWRLKTDGTPVRLGR